LITPTTLDFETEAIVGNPLLAPPRPVGLAVRWLDGITDYLTDPDQMAAAFRVAIDAGSVLFHNAPFDLSVARTWLNIPWPSWEKVHDTMYLLYLADPYAKTFSLKPSAERYLNIPPTEQDAVRDWVFQNVPGVTQKSWGAHISKAPLDILRPYAIQDVVDTYLLFEKLYNEIPTEPYDRERELMPILAEATVTGVRCNTPALEQGLELYTGAFEQVDNLLRATLQAPTLNPGSGQQLAHVLDDLGLVDNWVLTPTGQRSTDMKLLQVNDPSIMNMLKYRSTLKTLLGTFYKGWLEKEHNGRLHPNWNSTRGDRAGGTRTGRLSSSAPNFQNIPNPAGIQAPAGLPPLPNMRDYILPEQGHLWLKRDFDAQEIRVAAHFEDGALAEAFRQQPNLDPHELVREKILQLTGQDYPRKYVKETGFGILYGMGAATLGGRLGVNSNVSRDLIAAYKVAIPGVEKLQRGTKSRGRMGQPIRTWGGRLIYTEPPREVKGEWRSFEYKLLNYLIQGSSADQTKQCIIDWHSFLDYGEVFMATVHDEICISAPVEDWEPAMEHLRVCMEETCQFDVPMRSTGFTGPSWGEVGDD
jgi:DNA polymerase-1